MATRHARLNPETLVWSASSGPVQVDVYRVTRGRFEVDVANDNESRTYRADTREQAIAIAQHKLRQFATNPGFLSSLFGTRETVYPMRRGRETRTHAAPAGRETRYLGATIRQTADGDYATSIDWDSRFDTMAAAKKHVKWWMGRNRNPRNGTYRRVREIVRGVAFRRANPSQRAALLTFAKGVRG